MSDRILWGQIFAVLLIVLAAIWTATQSTAEALGFQAALGIGEAAVAAAMRELGEGADTAKLIRLGLKELSR